MLNRISSLCRGLLPGARARRPAPICNKDRRVHLSLETLEDRLVPTGNLVITGVSVVDVNDQPMTKVAAGQYVYIQADFTTRNVPANASYSVNFTVNGLTLESSQLTWGAGSAGSAQWHCYWGTFLATPGTNQVIVTVDPNHSVTETSYADNTKQFTFKAAAAPAGTLLSYTAAQLRDAYGVNSIPSFGAVPADGSGQTVAIINVGNDPTLLADVDGFDQAMSLTTTSAQTIYQQYGPASSFLTVYNQAGVNITASLANSGSNGVPIIPADSEESWDIEWVHAMAPGARIDEIEVNDDSSWTSNVLAAYGLAATLPGVSAVNWSGGITQSSLDTADDAGIFVTPVGHTGVTFLCPSNDNGANVYPSDLQSGDGYYPATSPNVVSVGGTALTVNNNGYGGETGWSFPTPATTVDDQSALFGTIGSWSSASGGFGGTYATAAPGSNSTATWTIPINPQDTGWGTELSATWTANAGNATNATYSIFDGTSATGTLLGTVTVDQTKAPTGTADGTMFQELGVFFPTLNSSKTGSLTVVLNAHSANGTVVADALGAAQAWASTGGPSLYEAEPSYQQPFQNTGYRTTPDVSFDADWSADGYGGGGLTSGGGGTSLGGPCWAGLIAIVNQGRVAEGGTTLNSQSNPQQTLQALYQLPQSDFHDVTTGYNGFNAGPGYDFVTGRGSPIANVLVPDLVRFELGNYYSALNNGQLTINSNSSGTDTITINVFTQNGGAYSTVAVQDNNAIDYFPVSSVRSIVVNTRAAVDTVNVDATPSGVPLTINLGAGKDTVNINGLGADQIDGGLGAAATVYGGTSTDALNVNDQALRSASTSYYVTDWSIQRNTGSVVNFAKLSQVTLNGASPDVTHSVVSYNVGSTMNGAIPALMYSLIASHDVIFFKENPGAATLNVDGGYGSAFLNLMDVGGQQNYFAPSQTVNISSGSADSNSENFLFVYTLPAGVALNIGSAGETHDFVYVGWGTEYSLTGIQGPINVSNTSGQTNLTVDGSDDLDADYTLTNTQLSVANGPTITYQGDNSSSLIGVTSITVDEGSANDCFDAKSVPTNTQVTVFNEATSSPSIIGAAASKIHVQP